jgi:hypothetical protein
MPIHRGILSFYFVMCREKRCQLHLAADDPANTVRMAQNHHARPHFLLQNVTENEYFENSE